MRAESPVEVWQVGRAVKDDRQVGPSLPMAVALQRTGGGEIK